MSKKCIPGLFCVENMTIFMLFFIFLLLSFTYFNFYLRPNIVVVPGLHNAIATTSNTTPMIGQLGGISTRMDSINDPYSPPLKEDGYYQSMYSSDIRPVPVIPRRAVPVNVETRGTGMNYIQVGILTRANGKDDMILPLMGKRNELGRDKWAYYTISNTGNINTKLPVSVNGRSCTGEYGCDEIYNNDTIYVEGYKDTFNATVYETGTFKYLPAI